MNDWLEEVARALGRVNRLAVALLLASLAFLAAARFRRRPPPPPPPAPCCHPARPAPAGRAP